MNNNFVRCAFTHNANFLFHFSNLPYNIDSCTRVSLRGVVAYVLDFDILVSGFENQSQNCVHFRSNALGKSKNSFHPSSYGLDSIITVLLLG